MKQALMMADIMSEFYIDSGQKMKQRSPNYS